MSAATAEAPPVSPVEYVRSLSPEDKEDVLFDLIRQVLAESNGAALIPFQPDGESLLGHFATLEYTQTMFEKYGPKLTPEERAEITELAKDPGETVSLEEMLELLGREDAELRR